MPVRHHSRGWLGRHRARRPWLVPAVALAVLAIGAGTAVVITTTGRAAAGGCHGGRTTVTVTIASAPGSYPVLDRLARQWTDAQPIRAGVCFAARVVNEQPNQVAAALSGNWDTSAGTRPDVWVPDSSLWLAEAAERAEAAIILPSSPPLLGTSPVVLAVRQPVAAALGWPDRTLTWQDVISPFGSPGGWAKLGHPEWAGLRLGLADPAAATAGLATTLMLLDSDHSGNADDQELGSALGFSQTVGALAPNTGMLLATQAATDLPDEHPVTGTEAVVAFPVVEAELAGFDADHPGQVLVPVYPDAGSVGADYPYAVLTADWVDPQVAAAADAFLDYLRGGEGQAALAAAGLRSPDGSVRNTIALPTALGFANTPVPPGPTVGPGVLRRLTAQWTALQRHANVLVAVDTSGSMGLPVPGTDDTRLQLLQDCAISGFDLLAGQSSVGLWSFSTAVSAAGYRELVPLGPVNGQVNGRSRQQAMINAVHGLRANGATPLYDTVAAAYRAMRDDWQPNSANIIVVITDGSNERSKGLTLPRLLGQLAAMARADRPVQVIGIAVGPEADSDALAQIAAATGGRVVVARDPATATQTLVLAFAGRLR